MQLGYYNRMIPLFLSSVVNARNTESSKVATVIGMSVAGTFVACFVVAAIVVACLVKHWKKTWGSLNETKQRERNHANGSTRTTTTDVGQYRSSLTDDEPINLKTMQKNNTTSEDNEAVMKKSTANSTNDAPCRTKRPIKSNPRSVSPMLMKPWAGPPRCWNEQNGGTPSNLYKNGHLTNERTASANSWVPAQDVQYGI